MHTLFQQIRHAVRTLSKTPGFTALAVLVLALGIGGNTAIFSLTNAFLFRPLALDRPEELVGCFSKSTKNPNSYRAFSYPNYCDLRERNVVFSGLAAHRPALVGLTEGDSTRRVFASIVSHNYFATLGAQLFQGRPFTPAEEQPGSALAVAIVSYEHWKKRGEDPNLPGKTIRLNGRVYTIVGITPKDFSGTTAGGISPEAWLPLGMYELADNDFEGVRRPLADRNNHCLFLVGRLKPGMTLAQADAQLGPLAAGLAQDFPKVNQDQTFITHGLSRFSISTSPQDDSEFKAVSLLLTAMAGAVLLIACLNLANMMLARGAARRKEFAVRLALGSGRGPILRQLLTEGMILSVTGGAAGLALAYWGVRVLVSSLRAMLPVTIVFRHGPDGRVLAAMLGLCVLSTLLFGFGPAWKASRPDVMSDLKESAGETLARGQKRRLFASRNLLVMGQLSLSLTLLVAAGLFIRGAMEAAQADPGFRLDNGLLVELDASMVGYDEARGRDIYRSLLERLRSLPGVEAASLAATVPFGNVSLGRSVQRAGEPERHPPGRQGNEGSAGAQYNVIAEDYFTTLGLGMLRGREFGRAETQGGPAPPVAIIDEVLARKLWPREDALGKHIQFRGEGSRRDDTAMEIVGIAPNIRDNLFGPGADAHVYVPFGQAYQSNSHIHLRFSSRASGGEAAWLQTVRREIRAFDEHLPVLSLKTLRGHVEGSGEVWIVRTAARMFSVFGSLALFLAVVGVYGVRAYTIARRTREIGIRMAMGATARKTLWMVVREGLLLTAVSLVLGLGLALAGGRLLSSMLYRVSPADPLVFLAAPLILTAASVLACYFPARRAARVDPMAALRCE
jgi:predicted permease